MISVCQFATWKRFGFGVVCGSIGFIPSHWLTKIILKILYDQNADLRMIPRFERLQSQGIYISAHSSAPLLEVVQQIKNNSENQLSLVSSLKILCFQQTVIIGPISEEIFCRGILQGVLLHKIPHSMIYPNNRGGINPLFTWWPRTVAVAAIFAYVHQSEESTLSSRTKTVHAFVLGVGLGCIKESRLKLAGAIGAHMVNNFISLIPLLSSK